jgi:ATP-dependent RNA circularization protein (DNA/RNA ligase family)
MSEYHKIQSIYKRDSAGRFINGEYSIPEFKLLDRIQWRWTEKIDGTNIRIMFNGEKVTFGGRTDNAQIPAQLIEKLIETFPLSIMQENFGSLRTDVVLYGEGYGAKIQKGGGDYIPDGCGFILFDVSIGGLCLTWETVEEIAVQLGISIVPVIGAGCLGDAEDLCRSGFKSLVKKVDSPPEGLVLRPLCDLFTRRGDRIITKIKLSDFRR